MHNGKCAIDRIVLELLIFGVPMLWAGATLYLLWLSDRYDLYGPHSTIAIWSLMFSLVCLGGMLTFCWYGMASCDDLRRRVACGMNPWRAYFS